MFSHIHEIRDGNDIMIHHVTDNDFDPSLVAIQQDMAEEFKARAKHIYIPELLEKQLFDYCKESFIRIGDQSMDRLNTDLLDCFPQWYYVPYSSGDYTGRVLSGLI